MDKEMSGINVRYKGEEFAEFHKASIDEVSHIQKAVLTQDLRDIKFIAIGDYLINFDNVLYIEFEEGE